MKRLLLLFFLLACSSPETRVREEFKIPSWQLEKLKELDKRPQIFENSTYLDARPYFLYQLSHVDGSHPISPDDFFQVNSAGKTVLTSKHFFQARRLARYGLSKDSPVVVIGRGKAGEGEEWLLKLYLNYIGVKEVLALDPKGFSFKETSVIPILPSSEKTWKPTFNESLIVTASDIASLKAKADLRADNTMVVDVNPAAQYLNSEVAELAGIPRINIPCQEFLGDNSRPNTKIFDSLVSAGLHPNKRILCVDDQISNAAVACMVLQEMGFYNAGVYLK